VVTNLNAGAFAGGGAFHRGPRGAKSCPISPQRPWAAGAFVGLGAGPFITNAKSASDLAGISNGYNLNIGIGPIKFGVAFGYGNGIGILSVTFSPGIGASSSGYATSAVTT
jgi:hypothetical protein